MELLWEYGKAFLVGGALCVLGQLLIDYTKQGLLRSRLEDMNFSADDLEKETDAYLDYLERLTKK